jgi:hypothetical protein
MSARRAFGVVMLLGCAARHPAPPTTAAPTAATVRRPPLRGMALLPNARQRAVYVGREADGRYNAVNSGHRLLAFEDEVTLAAEGFVAPLVGVWRTRRGWVFVADDGASARSTDYLGPLVRMRDLDLVTRAYPNVEHSQTFAPSEAVVAVDVAGRAWVTDGASDWAPVTLPIPGRVTVGEFTAGGMAVLIVEGGYVFHSLDAGRSWTRIEGLRLSDAVTRGDDITATGGRFDRASHSFVAGALPSEEPPGVDRVSLLPDTGSACFAADPRLIDAMTSLELAGGHFAVVAPNQQALVFYDGPTGAVVARRELPGWGQFPPSMQVLPDGSVFVRGERSPELTARFAADGSNLPTDIDPDAVGSAPHGDEPPRSHARPEGADGATFADERYGLAWRLRPFELQRTTDGGQSWTPWALPVDGAIDPASIIEDNDPAPSCSRWRCRFGRLVLWGWDDLPADAPRQLARLRPAPPPVAPAPWPDLDTLVGDRCSVEPLATPLLRYPVAPAGTLPEVVTASGPGGDVQVLRVHDANDRRQLWIRWRGRDAAGLWRSPLVRLRDDDVDPDTRRYLREEQVRLTVFDLAREHVSLDFNAPRARVPFAIELQASGAWRATSPGARSPAGAAARLFDESRILNRMRRIFRRVNPRSGDEAREAAPYEPEERRMAVVLSATRGATAGDFVVSDPQRLRGTFHPDGGEPSEVPLPASSPWTACVGAASAETVTIYTQAQRRAGWGVADPMSRVFFTLEVRPAGLCVRRVVASDEHATAVVEATDAHGMVGSLTEGGRQRVLRCAL